ncbi:MAG: Gfo/Idh/MocA family oxidoreductase [Puniceicoccales bacterium]|jgi:predicted dehydrogenase|nr:Gfo/Idh/MocA family oxidoreductase [Puniceicoccales bacterium]
MKKPILSRRDFVKKASLASGLLILPSGFLRGQTAPSSKVNVAGIGVAGMGAGDIQGINGTKGANIIGLCDVDSQRLKNAQGRYPGAAIFADYREMLDKLGDKIDAVSVSTPDHTHFTAAYEAIQRGKHVYVQKPLCHTVDQVRRLTALAVEKKVVTQMGNQGSSSAHLRTAKEWYDLGLLGDVSLVDAWSDRPKGGGWPQGMKKFPPTKAPPSTLDWKLWLGPVADRQYSPELHPFKWRGYYDYGCGALGDMAIHLMYDAYFVLDLTAPTKIEVDVPDKSEIAFPTASTVTFHFPANDKRGPVKFVWRDGGRKPDVPGTAIGGNGSLLHGKNFVLSLSGWGQIFQPLVSNDERARLVLEGNKIKGKYPRFAPHYKSWIDSIRKGTAVASDFRTAGPFAEIILLGVIAQRVGRTLNWDSKAGLFINDPEANRLLKAAQPTAGFLA